MSDLPPLRIAMITGSLAHSGAEKQFYYAVRSLVQAGITVQVYSTVEIDYYYELIKELGVPIIWFGQSKYILLRIIRLIFLLQNFRPHILHTAQLFAGIYSGTVGRLLGIPSLGNTRSSQHLQVQQLGLISYYLALQLPNMTVSNSRTAYDELLSTKIITPDRLSILNNVLDIDLFDREKIQSLEQELDKWLIQSKTIIYVGRLLRNKRVDRFLYALAKARITNPQLQGLVVGAGVEETALKTLAGHLGLLPDAVRFLGMRQDIPSLLAHTAILVMCSDSEGTPNVILEAMTASLPVITTPAGDSPYLVNHGKTGYVVNFDDIDLMACHLTNLISNSRLHQEFGMSGRAIIEANYDSRKLGKNLLVLYKKLASQQRKNKTLMIIQEYLDRQIEGRDDVVSS